MHALVIYVTLPWRNMLFGVAVLRRWASDGCIRHERAVRPTFKNWTLGASVLKSVVEVLVDSVNEALFLLQNRVWRVYKPFFADRSRHVRDARR